MRVAVFFLLLIPSFLNAQDTLSYLAPAQEFNKNRFCASEGVQLIGYGSSLIFLNNLWYKNYPHSRFHFFDDSHEWLQMDKAGHLFTSYYMGKVGNDLAYWSGAKSKQVIFYSGINGFLFLTGIEVLDGFSTEWGFSWSDFAANTLGAGFIIGQRIAQYSNSQSRVSRIYSGMCIKFSYSDDKYAKYRSDLLGNTFSEKLVKGYNGQTYWASFNISSFLKSESKFPKWLNIALGYGAEGMISGMPGYLYTPPNGSKIYFERYKQYYLSLDIDLTKINSRSYFIRTLCEAFSFIKIPSPTLEISKRGFFAHALYF